jgi:hypothetical protein
MSFWPWMTSLASWILATSRAFCMVEVLALWNMSWPITFIHHFWQPSSLQTVMPSSLSPFGLIHPYLPFPVILTSNYYQFRWRGPLGLLIQPPQDAIVYGRHLLWFGESHELLTWNDLLCFLGSSHLTCLLHGRGASMVEYVMTNHLYTSFLTTLIPSNNYALISFSLRADPRLPTFPQSLSRRTTINFDEGDPQAFSSHLH